MELKFTNKKDKPIYIQGVDSYNLDLSIPRLNIMFVSEFHYAQAVNDKVIVPLIDEMSLGYVPMTLQLDGMCFKLRDDYSFTSMTSKDLKSPEVIKPTPMPNLPNWTPPPPWVGPWSGPMNGVPPTQPFTPPSQMPVSDKVVVQPNFYQGPVPMVIPPFMSKEEWDQRHNNIQCSAEGVSDHIREEPTFETPQPEGK